MTEVKRVTRKARPGKGGVPQVFVSENLLREAVRGDRNLSKTKIASLLGIHRNTLSRKMKEMGIEREFSNLNDEELDGIVQQFQEARPDSGKSYLTGELRSQGFRIQRSRIRDSVKRVNPIAPVLRQTLTIQRREYEVPRPNALWHLDGHHKLIKYGIVIHGVVDGYSRYVRQLHLLVNF